MNINTAVLFTAATLATEPSGFSQDYFRDLAGLHAPTAATYEVLPQEAIVSPNGLLAAFQDDRKAILFLHREQTDAVWVASQFSIVASANTPLGELSEDVASSRPVAISNSGLVLVDTIRTSQNDHQWILMGSQTFATLPQYLEMNAVPNFQLSPDVTGKIEIVERQGRRSLVVGNEIHAFGYIPGELSYGASSPGTLQMTWVGQNYKLMQQEALGNSTWEAVVSPITQVGITHSVTVPTTDSQRYFQLELDFSWIYGVPAFSVNQ